MTDPHAIIEAGSRWLNEHVGSGIPWEQAEGLFFDDRDRRKRGEEGEIPQYAYDYLEKRFGHLARGYKVAEAARRDAAIDASFARQAAQARYKALGDDPRKVAALERLIAAEIEAEEYRTDLKVAI